MPRTLMQMKPRVSNIGKRLTFEVDGLPVQRRLDYEADWTGADKAISIESPVGAALMYATLGESIDANTPAGVVRVTLRKVENVEEE